MMRGSMSMSAMWHHNAKCNDDLRLKEKRLRLCLKLLLYCRDVESGCEFGGNKGKYNPGGDPEVRTFAGVNEG